MKVWVLAGLFTAALAPIASAAENTLECQLDETRRSTTPRLEEQIALPPQPAAITRPTAAASAPTRQVAEENVQRAEPARRRNGKRIPDAELIGPRGAL